MAIVVPSHGKQGRFYLGSLDMSAYVESVRAAFERDLAQHQPLLASTPTQVPGHSRVTFTLGGAALVAGSGHNEEHAWAMLNADGHTVMSYVPYRDIRGEIAFCGLTKYANHSMDAGDDVLRLPVGVVSSETIELCRILRALASVGISPSTAVDNGDATGNGGAGFLHVTAIGAGAALNVDIEDSANGVDFTSLLSFVEVTPATLATSGAQRVQVAAGAAVRQYLRLSWTLAGGAATATWFASFGRR